MKRLIIQKNDLSENIQKIKAHGKKTNTNIIAMIKGNGYGLGICEFAKLLEENDINTFSVSLLEEALKLRNAGITSDIMLLSPLCDTEDVKVALEQDIILCISSPESATAVNIATKQTDKYAKIQLAIDTGFGRFGFLYNKTSEAATCVSALEKCEVVGCFSHFSDSFGKDEKHTRIQFNRFKSAVADLNTRGVNTPLCHICNSSAFLRYDDMHLDAVRIGSAFLGRILTENNLSLKRIAYLESKVIEVKTLPKGYNIGYANTCTTKKETKIAVVPIGYMDGFGVIKENDTYRFFDCLRYVYHDLMSVFRDKKTYVDINEKKCPVLGRISMFNIVVDITGMNVYTGDTVKAQCNPVLIDSSVVREYR